MLIESQAATEFSTACAREGPNLCSRCRSSWCRSLGLCKLLEFWRYKCQYRLRRGWHFRGRKKDCLLWICYLDVRWSLSISRGTVLHVQQGTCYRVESGSCSNRRRGWHCKDDSTGNYAESEILRTLYTSTAASNILRQASLAML